MSERKAGPCARLLITALALLGAISLADEARAGSNSPAGLEGDIQFHASRLQSKCDEKRIELRRDFMDTVVVPVRQEIDSIVSRLNAAERRRLDATLKRILSERADIRMGAIDDARSLLQLALARSQLRGMDAEVIPGTPFPVLLVTNGKSIWRSREFEPRIRYSGAPGQTAYRYELNLSVQDAVEAQLPVECRIFLTGLNPNALYAFSSEPPAPGTQPDPTDPNRILAELSPKAARSGPQVTTSRTKPGMDSEAPEPKPGRTAADPKSGPAR